MPNVTRIDDGKMVVDLLDDDGEPAGSRPATVAEQNAAVLRALGGVPDGGA